MAFIVRDKEIVPIAIPVGKRVKICSAYVPPLPNYISDDQLWVQDVFTFQQIPWYAIRNRAEKWLLMLAIWGSITYMLSFIGRHYLGAS